MKNKKEGSKPKEQPVEEKSTLKTNSIVKSKPKPNLNWQTGDYERHADFRFRLPYQFLLLCKLLNVTPEQILLDFMDNASLGSWKREGREGARDKIKDYLLECKYGQDHYQEGDIWQMFEELDSIGRLWPEGARMKLIDLHAKWRDKYHKYWFKKWYRKPRRKAIH
ncbi:MAG TPA: hypothetical protein VNS32_20200 [Flavisolibacter sp.]|nr:hypothetical protein [Flavisolibacter sp.]